MKLLEAYSDFQHFIRILFVTCIPLLAIITVTIIAQVLPIVNQRDPQWQDIGQIVVALLVYGFSLLCSFKVNRHAGKMFVFGVLLYMFSWIFWCFLVIYLGHINVKLNLNRAVEDFMLGFPNSNADVAKPLNGSTHSSEDECDVFKFTTVLYAASALNWGLLEAMSILFCLMILRNNLLVIKTDVERNKKPKKPPRSRNGRSRELKQFSFKRVPAGGETECSSPSAIQQAEATLTV